MKGFNSQLPGMAAFNCWSILEAITFPDIYSHFLMKAEYKILAIWDNTGESFNNSIHCGFNHGCCQTCVTAELALYPLLLPTFLLHGGWFQPRSLHNKHLAYYSSIPNLFPEKTTSIDSKKLRLIIPEYKL